MAINVYQVRNTEIVAGGTYGDQLYVGMQDAVFNAQQRERVNPGQRDRCNQLGCMILGCPILCAPCGVARLFGHCTGLYDPKCIKVGYESCYPGRGYNEVGYTESPRVGTGFSKRSLDMLATGELVAYVGIMAGVMGPQIVASIS